MSGGSMIGVDWGTSSFRAFRLCDGEIVDRVASKSGLLAAAGRFEETLRETVGPWLADGEQKIVMAGMIGSQQGWVEAPYLECPANIDALADALVPVPFEGAEVKLIPGVSAIGPSGVPEVMRGEETQILGALAGLGEDAIVCLPGTHSKWVRVTGGRIMDFATYMTGESFAAYSGHTILGRKMQPDAPTDEFALARGLERSGEPGGLLRHLFGVRTLGLWDKLGEATAPSYLSGLLLGHEIRAALADFEPGTAIWLIGDPRLTDLYQRAIALCGGHARVVEGECAAIGLGLIGQVATWQEMKA